MQSISVEQMSYTEWEKLSQEEIQPDLLERINLILKNESAWVAHFKLIDEIRAYNKFKPDELLNLLDLEFNGDKYYLLNAMSSWANSLRSNVQKNALMLYKEIVTTNKIETLSSGALCNLLSRIFDKLDSDYKFLKQEANLALTNLQAKTFSQFETGLVDALTQLSQSSSHAKIQMHAYPLLVKYLGVMPVSELNQLWIMILRTTVNLSNGKSVECRNAATQLVTGLKDRGQLDQAVDFLNQNEQENNLAEALRKLSVQKSKSTKPSFRDFRAQQGSKSQQAQQIEDDK